MHGTFYVFFVPLLYYVGWTGVTGVQVDVQVQFQWMQQLSSRRILQGRRRCYVLHRTLERLGCAATWPRMVTDA